MHGSHYPRDLCNRKLFELFYCFSCDKMRLYAVMERALESIQLDVYRQHKEKEKRTCLRLPSVNTTKYDLDFLC